MSKLFLQFYSISQGLLPYYIFLVTIYSLISLVTEWSYILEDNGNYFAVCYPFTETRFLLGENIWDYKIFSFLIPIGAYGIFFHLVSNVFNAFKQPKLFTSNGINQLKWFCLANIFVPSFIILLASIFTEKVEDGLQTNWKIILWKAVDKIDSKVNTRNGFFVSFISNLRK